MLARQVTWRSIVTILGSLFIFSVLQACAAWNVEIVQPHKRKVLSSVALAYDNAGTPSIAYGDKVANEVRLASKSGAAWPFEIVASHPISTGIRHAYDSQGKPAVLFISKGKGLGNFTLYYAEKVSGVWQTTRIEHPVKSGKLSLAFDSNDIPSIAYCKNDSLYFARRPAADWVVESVVQNANIYTVSLAYSGNEAPVIAYTEDQTTLKLASKSGSTWTQETITTAPSIIATPQLAFNPATGDATVLYHVVHCAMKLARKSGGTWQFEDVGRGISGSQSLAHNSRGTPYVAYRNCDVNNQLLVTNKGSGSWSPAEVVDSSTFDLAFNDPSIRIDGNGKPALSYPKRSAGSGPRDLRFAVGSSAAD